MATRIDLTRLAKRPRNRRAVTIRDIAPPAMFATNLYRAVYAPIVATVQRYTERLIAEYERTLSGMTTDSAADLSSILDELGAELSRLVLTLEPALRDWLLRVETWQRGRWVAAVLSASGVDLGSMLTVGDVRETLEAYLSWNAGLVRDVGDQARQRISNVVFAGLQNRSPAREVAREIREATGFARDRSLRIASDQLSKVSAALADERRVQARLSVWQWVHSRKRHPRSEHVARDGNLYSDDKAMVGREVDGKTVLRAPERNDLPSRPPYCGCRSLSVMIWDD